MHHSRYEIAPNPPQFCAVNHRFIPGSITTFGRIGMKLSCSPKGQVVAEKQPRRTTILLKEGRTWLYNLCLFAITAMLPGSAS